MSFLHQHISLFFPPPLLLFFSQHGRHSQSVCFTSKTGRSLKLWHWLMHWKHPNPQPVASPLHNAQRTEDKTGDTRDGDNTSAQMYSWSSLCWRKGASDVSESLANFYLSKFWIMFSSSLMRERERERKRNRMGLSQKKEERRQEKGEIRWSVMRWLRRRGATAAAGEMVSEGNMMNNDDEM